MRLGQAGKEGQERRTGRAGEEGGRTCLSGVGGPPLRRGSRCQEAGCGSHEGPPLRFPCCEKHLIASLQLWVYHALPWPSSPSQALPWQPQSMRSVARVPGLPSTGCLCAGVPTSQPRLPPSCAVVSLRPPLLAQASGWLGSQKAAPAPHRPQVLLPLKSYTLTPSWSLLPREPNQYGVSGFTSILSTRQDPFSLFRPQWYSLVEMPSAEECIPFVFPAELGWEWTLLCPQQGLRTLLL